MRRAGGTVPDRAPWVVTAGQRLGATRLEEALNADQGTVTDFLEDVASEPIDADILSQRTTTPSSGNWLGLAPSAARVRRAVLLRWRWGTGPAGLGRRLSAPPGPAGSRRYRSRRNRPIGACILAVGLRACGGRRRPGPP